MNKRRHKNLLPGGIPKNVRCYDDTISLDRYTVVFTRCRGTSKGLFHPYLMMSACPLSPTGLYRSSESQEPLDRPYQAHLGKEIKFEDLPEPAKGLALSRYCELWNLK